MPSPHQFFNKCNENKAYLNAMSATEEKLMKTFEVKTSSVMSSDISTIPREDQSQATNATAQGSVKT